MIVAWRERRAQILDILKESNKQLLDDWLVMNGIPLQYSCLENPMDGGAWRSLVGYSPRGRKESDTTK